MDFDEEAVRAGGDAGHRDRRNEPRDPHRMRRIDDNRKMRHFLEQGDDGNVEQVASRRIKRPDATFAQNDALVSAEHHVFGGEQPLLHRCGETAL